MCKFQAEDELNLHFEACRQLSFRRMSRSAASGLSTGRLVCAHLAQAAHSMHAQASGLSMRAIQPVTLTAQYTQQQSALNRTRAYVTSAHPRQPQQASSANAATVAEAAERWLQGKPFTVQRIEGAGRGLVATRDIKAGVLRQPV